jgi:hypothetical protein
MPGFVQQATEECSACEGTGQKYRDQDKYGPNICFFYDPWSMLCLTWGNNCVFTGANDAKGASEPRRRNG